MCNSVKSAFLSDVSRPESLVHVGNVDVYFIFSVRFWTRSRIESSIKLELKMFSEHRPHAAPWNHPLAVMEWSRLLLRDDVCSQHVPFRRCEGVMGVHSAFLVTDDLDHLWPWHSNLLSEGPNTSSLWIWCKSVQRSRDICFTNKKSHRQC